MAIQDRQDAEVAVQQGLSFLMSLYVDTPILAAHPLCRSFNADSILLFRPVTLIRKAKPIE